MLLCSRCELPYISDPGLHTRLGRCLFESDIGIELMCQMPAAAAPLILFSSYDRPTPGKPKHHGINKIKAVRNLRSVAEERVGAKFTNMRVLNSYWINQDATFKYYEVRCERGEETEISKKAQRSERTSERVFFFYLAHTTLSALGDLVLVSRTCCFLVEFLPPPRGRKNNVRSNWDNALGIFRSHEATLSRILNTP